MSKKLFSRIAPAPAVVIAAVTVAVLSMFILWEPVACAEDARVAVMGIESLRSGMKGIGRTVFHGIEPEDFGVEIIGIMRRGGQLGDMILVRVSGPAVEASGGVAEGMSGSPVYVEGKLIGAIAYVFPGSDHFVAGVTPIADMLRILDYPDSVSAVACSGGSIGASAGAGVGASMRAAAPVFVSGLAGRALDRLSGSLERFGTTVRPAVSLGAGRAEPGHAVRAGDGAGDGADVDGAARAVAIRPGSAIALHLAQGDVEITAFGTVTYVDGDRFLAFGHPVLGNGTTDLAASGAFVHGVITSDRTPFKVLSSGDPIGAFTQDRLNGVAGRLGRQAGEIPVSVTVLDLETGREKTISAQVAPEESLVADIFGAAALAAFDGVMDRVGGGTADVVLSVKMGGRDSYERCDTFWSGSDVAGASLSDAFDTVGLIANSAAERVAIEGITLRAEVGAHRRTAVIEKAKVLQKVVRPGQQVDVEVTLRLFRGPRVTKVLSLTMPNDMGSGIASLMVRGGGVSFEDDMDSWVKPVEELLCMDVDDMLAELGSRPLGNDIVLELEPYLLEEPRIDMGLPVDVELHEDSVSGGDSSDATGKDSGKDKAKEDAHATLLSEPVSVRAQTDWVIQGIKWLTVDIETETEVEVEEPGEVGV
jgi:hypothetical protein